MPSPPPGTMGANKRGQNGAEEDAQEPEGAKSPRAGSTLETTSNGTPDQAGEEVSGPTWSNDVGELEDCVLSCFCPCIVTGRNLQRLGLAPFAKGCAPVGLLLACTIIFFSLPYWTDNGPCSFPTALWEWSVTEGFFGGNCTPTEYVSVPFTRVSWFCFAICLNVIRRRIADDIGIHEKYCPSLFFQCCCCYACLLSTEMRTVREVAHKRGPPAEESVGEAVVVQTLDTVVTLACQDQSYSSYSWSSNCGGDGGSGGGGS
eukprot:CAMPEP_0172844400 /NCGR_PEP_ID=MMETSP1075-20121228/32187_1 /TAXON_ID=2916 /ORGANISM="Ceratium fusus, Strain PA161109" /LENGTH=259 /DNA_ID=CAMNT_0013688835 /DNA_START=35 /DNA_END=812 /DNA_ORIENTATION=-